MAPALAKSESSLRPESGSATEVLGSGIATLSRIREQVQDAWQVLQARIEEQDETVQRLLLELSANCRTLEGPASPRPAPPSPRPTAPPAKASVTFANGAEEASKPRASLDDGRGSDAVQAQVSGSGLRLWTCCPKASSEPVLPVSTIVLRRADEPGVAPAPVSQPGCSPPASDVSVASEPNDLVASADQHPSFSSRTGLEPGAPRPSSQSIPQEASDRRSRRGSADRWSRTSGECDWVPEDEFALPSSPNGTRRRSFTSLGRIGDAGGLLGHQYCSDMQMHLLTRIFSQGGFNLDRPWLWTWVQIRCLDLAEWWSGLKEPPRQGWLARFVDSTWFEMVCSLVIAANSVWAVWEVNRRIKTLTALGPTGVLIEWTFIAFYTIENILKLLVHRMHYFVNEDWSHNNFSFGLTALEAASLIVMTLQPQMLLQVAFLRSCRIFAKVLRVFRLFHLFPEVRMILNTLLSSLVSIVWCLIVMLFALLLFALLLVQFVTVYLKANVDYECIPDPHAPCPMEDLQRHFGSVEQAMMSLYMAVTGGIDWITYFELFLEVGWGSAAAFVGYTFLLHFGMFNLLTSMFIDRTIKACKPDAEDLVAKQREKEHEQFLSLKQTLEEFDRDGNGRITRSEFFELIADKKVTSYLAALGLEITDADIFFEVLMAITDTEDLPIADFVQGCMRMKGYATGIDMKALQYDIDRKFRGLEEKLFYSQQLRSSRLSSERGLDFSPRPSRRDSLRDSLGRASRASMSPSVRSLSEPALPTFLSGREPREPGEPGTRYLGTSL